MIKKLLLIVLIFFVFVVIILSILIIPNLNKPSVAPNLKGFTLSPKEYTQESFKDFFTKATQAGNAVGWYGDINELLQDKSAAYTVLGLAKTYNYKPLLIVTFANQNTGELLSTFDPQKEQGYIDSIKSIISRYDLDYFGIGIEVNLIKNKNTGNYNVFKSFFDNAYSQIKLTNPNTKIFTTIQLELLENLEEMNTDYYYGDLAAFTSYPEIKFANVDAIPSDYYSKLNDYSSNRALAFTEIGWSRANNQTGFIKIFNTQLSQLNTNIKIWSFLYDAPTDLPLFKTMGILDSSDNSQSFDEWNSED